MSLQQLSNAGGRLIISSDGVWDAVTFEMAVSCSRGLPAEVAAAQIVKVLPPPHELLLLLLLLIPRIIIVVVVVVFLFFWFAGSSTDQRDSRRHHLHRGGHPAAGEEPAPPASEEAGEGRLQVHVPAQVLRVDVAIRSRVFRAGPRGGDLRGRLRRARPEVPPKTQLSSSSLLLLPLRALISRVSICCRLDTEYPICNMFKLFMCAVCQVEFKPGEGTSVHAGSLQTGRLRPWDGPFLCRSCHAKKEAMEGKRLPGEGSPPDLLISLLQPPAISLLSSPLPPCFSRQERQRRRIVAVGRRRHRTCLAALPATAERSRRRGAGEMKQRGPPFPSLAFLRRRPFAGRRPCKKPSSSREQRHPPLSPPPAEVSPQFIHSPFPIDFPERGGSLSICSSSPCQKKKNNHTNDNNSLCSCRIIPSPVHTLNN